jgi:hypothetical protein
MDLVFQPGAQSNTGHLNMIKKEKIGIIFQNNNIDNYRTLFIPLY